MQTAYQNDHLGRSESLEVTRFDQAETGNSWTRGMFYRKPEGYRVQTGTSGKRGTEKLNQTSFMGIHTSSLIYCFV